MSTHACEVVPINLETHPNADKLSIVKVFGYIVCVRTQDFSDAQVGIYIPPDSVVPDNDRFAFLDGHNRIKVRKFRGIISQGLLMQAPDCTEADLGRDFMEEWGITHYEPPLPFSAGGDNEKGPPGCYPKYDVENYNRYGHILHAGEEVSITEKIHGANARFLWTEDRIWVGTRTNWKKQDDKNLWWQALIRNPWIEEWCKEHPDLVVYGEVFGRVQTMQYGAGPQDMFFRAFDILDKNRWMDHEESKKVGAGLEWVPELYKGPFDEPAARLLAEGNSTIPGADHIREGIVIKPVMERQDPEIGRVQMKIVSNKYLEKS